MSRSLRLLAAAGAIRAAAQDVTDVLTDLPTLTRDLPTPNTPTITGPKTTVTVPIMGMENFNHDELGDWYASIVSVDREEEATVYAAEIPGMIPNPDEKLTFTYGPSGYTQQLESLTYDCTPQAKENVLACEVASGTLTDDLAMPSLSDMYVPVTVTAGLELLESSAPSSDDDDNEDGSQNEGEEENSDGGDDEGAAGAGPAVDMVVAGFGVVAALAMM